MPTARAARFYFSLRSPYSWLAYRDMLEHVPHVADMLEWIPFWEPDARSSELLAGAGGGFVYTPMSREKHLYILQDVRRLAAARGLTVVWPVDRDVLWEVPHLAYLYAHSCGSGRPFIEQAYRARWQEGRDICDPAVVSQLSSEIGLCGERAATAFNDERWRERGVRALLASYGDGVFGVPFFVYRRAKFWGVDRLSAFVAALGDPRAPDEPREDPRRRVCPVASRGLREADGGHEGGCG